MHLYMIELAQKRGFHFDTVQMPINVMDAHFRSFNKLVCPAADKAGIGVIAMKSMGAGVILKSKTASPEECLRYTLSQPASSRDRDRQPGGLGSGLPGGEEL